MSFLKPEEEVLAGMKKVIYILKSTDDKAQRLSDYIEFYKDFHLKDCPACKDAVRVEFFEKFVEFARYANDDEFTFMQLFFELCIDIERAEEEFSNHHGR